MPILTMSGTLFLLISPWTIFIIISLLEKTHLCLSPFEFLS